MESTRDDARPAVGGVRMLRQRRLVDLTRRRVRRAVILDEHIEPVRCGTTRRAEEAIEAVVNRPANEAARESTRWTASTPSPLTGWPSLSKNVSPMCHLPTHAVA